MNPLALVAQSMDSKHWTLLFPAAGFLLGLLAPLVAAFIYVGLGGDNDAAGGMTFLVFGTIPLGWSIGVGIRRIILRDINDTWD